MRIAVNLTGLEKGGDETCSFFTEVLNQVIIQHPEHTFIVIAGSRAGRELATAANMIAVQPAPDAPWFLRPLLRPARQYAAISRPRADVLLLFGAGSILRKIPCCMVINDRLVAEAMHGGRHQEKRLSRCVTAAATIGTFTHFSRQQIIQRFQFLPNRISVIPPSAGEHFQPATIALQEQAKQQFASGREYFISNARHLSYQQLIDLLKAFSVFKKRSGSNMHLVLYGLETAGNKALHEALSTYRHRTAVTLLNSLSRQEKAQLISGAYAFLCIRVQDSAIGALAAMRCNVPLIAVRNDLFQEVCGEAAVYFDPGNAGDLAEKWYLLYKDEKLRSRLVQRCKKQSAQYSTAIAAAALWKAILLAGSRL